jgi:hypothetical protein
MRTPIVSALCVAFCACASGSGAAKGAGLMSSTATFDTAHALVNVRFGDHFSPDVGPAALKAFVPDIAASDSAGQCSLRKMPGSSNANVASASFPNRAAAQMSVSLTFDSVGHLVQYSEMRGVVVLRGLPPGTSQAQRDSMLKAAHNAMRSTMISINYSIGQAILRNEGGGKADNAVLTAPREVEGLAKLGPIRDRLVRVRKLCGV